MNNYEILYILSDKQDADGKKALVERFKALVAPYGEVTAEEWGGGSRKLEYPIQLILCADEVYRAARNSRRARTSDAHKRRRFALYD